MRAVGFCLLLCSVAVMMVGCGSSPESGSSNGGNSTSSSTEIDVGTGANHTFNFLEVSYSALEGQSVNITINRSSTIGQATVMYGTQGITAQPSSDYAGYDWTELVFYDGEFSKSIPLQTVADNVLEGNETLRVLLSSPSTGYTVGVNAYTTVSIINLDTPQVNSLPSISGSPATSVTEGNQYSFVPNASDPDSTDLTFTITNQPSWALFDSSTGSLTGIPSTVDVGIYFDIAITVSDGVSETTLPAFSITVNAAPVDNGTTTLSWRAPTTNVDGSPLTDLAGYEIHYGTDANTLDQQIVINSPGITEYLVENLPRQVTLYFAVSAFDEAGQRGPLSNVASTTIQ